MSNAQPMDYARRLSIYDEQAPGRVHMTARQFLQYNRMGRLEGLRDRGSLPPTGASGLRVRRPIPRTSRPPERGSFATHVMVAPSAPAPVRLWKRVPR